MTKLLTLATLVGSLLVAGVASADTDATRARPPTVDHRSDRDVRAGDRMARRDGDQPDRVQRRGPRRQRAAEAGRCHGKGMGMRKQRPDRAGDSDGRRGPRNDRPDRRDA